MNKIYPTVYRLCYYAYATVAFEKTRVMERPLYLSSAFVTEYVTPWRYHGQRNLILFRSNSLKPVL